MRHRKRVGAGSLDPHDRASAEEVLGILGPWAAGVYLRYSDAKLRDCWLWHPDVVEELLWPHAASLAVYEPHAAISAGGDRHDGLPWNPARSMCGISASVRADSGLPRVP